MPPGARQGVFDGGAHARGDSCYRPDVPQERPEPSDPDQFVTAERSMFGTRLPRPTGVGRHLIVVFVVSALALGLAIAFAERATKSAPASTQP